MSYFVYEATFVTDLGVKRSYIGYSRGDPSCRELSLQRPGRYQPAWLALLFVKASCSWLYTITNIFAFYPLEIRAETSRTEVSKTSPKQAHQMGRLLGGRYSHCTVWLDLLWAVVFFCPMDLGLVAEAKGRKWAHRWRVRWGLGMEPYESETSSLSKKPRPRPSV